MACSGRTRGNRPHGFSPRPACIRSPASSATRPQQHSRPGSVSTAGLATRRRRSVGSCARGTAGGTCRRCRKWLTAVGIRTAADGVFGPHTEQAAASFQSAARLHPVSGVVGVVTAMTLRRWVDQSKHVPAGSRPTGTGPSGAGGWVFPLRPMSGVAPPAEPGPSIRASTIDTVGEACGEQRRRGRGQFGHDRRRGDQRLRPRRPDPAA